MSLYSVCVCARTCVYTLVCAGALMCAHVLRPETAIRCLVYRSPHYFFETVTKPVSHS